MNKIVIAIIIACFSKGIFAACPTPIGMAGTFSGRATYTELTNGVVSDVTEQVMVVKLNGAGNAIVSGVATVLKDIEASQGNAAVTINSPPNKIFAYTFDSSSCSGIVTENTVSTVYFVVANGGNTLYGVERSLNFPGIKRFELTRQ